MELFQECALKEWEFLLVTRDARLKGREGHVAAREATVQEKEKDVDERKQALDERERELWLWEETLSNHEKRNNSVSEGSSFILLASNS